MDCHHNCAACGGCQSHGELELTQGELDLLELLEQFAFLPIARKAEDPAPLYPEGDAYSQAEYSLILQVLEKKGLLSLDFDKPLKNFSCEKYGDYPIVGSAALTERGQKVIDILRFNGIS